MTSKTISPTRRQALVGAAATLAAAKALLPSGAFAAGPGPEVAKARLGFIALTDASPLIIAKERGFFAKYGMPDVEVLKQASWGGTRWRNRAARWGCARSEFGPASGSDEYEGGSVRRTRATTVPAARSPRRCPCRDTSAATPPTR